MEFLFYRFTAGNRNPNSLCANIRISFNGTTKAHRKLLIFLLVYVQLTKKLTHKGIIDLCMISSGTHDVAQISILKSQNVISSDLKQQDLTPATI